MSQQVPVQNANDPTGQVPLQVPLQLYPDQNNQITTTAGLNTQSYQYSSQPVTQLYSQSFPNPQTNTANSLSTASSSSTVNHDSLHNQGQYPMQQPTQSIQQLYPNQVTTVVGGTISAQAGSSGATNTINVPHNHEYSNQTPINSTTQMFPNQSTTTSAETFNNSNFNTQHYQYPTQQVSQEIVQSFTNLPTTTSIGTIQYPNQQTIQSSGNQNNSTITVNGGISLKAPTTSLDNQALAGGGTILANTQALAGGGTILANNQAIAGGGTISANNQAFAGGGTIFATVGVPSAKVDGQNFNIHHPQMLNATDSKILVINLDNKDKGAKKAKEKRRRSKKQRNRARVHDSKYDVNLLI